MRQTQFRLGHIQQVFSALVAALLICCVGCVSETVASRIAARQETFDAYDAVTQERLQRGQIRIGDDTDAVWMVYGNPTQKIRRTDANGHAEVWIYKILGYSDRLNHGVRPVYQDVGGRLRGSYYIDDTPEYEWKEVLRIEFVNGRVSAVQFSE